MLGRLALVMLLTTPLLAGSAAAEPVDVALDGDADASTTCHYLAYTLTVCVTGASAAPQGDADGGIVALAGDGNATARPACTHVYTGSVHTLHHACPTLIALAPYGTGNASTAAAGERAEVPAECTLTQVYPVVFGVGFSTCGAAAAVGREGADGGAVSASPAGAASAGVVCFGGGGWATGVRGMGTSGCWRGVALAMDDASGGVAAASLAGDARADGACRAAWVDSVVDFRTVRCLPPGAAVAWEDAEGTVAVSVTGRGHGLVAVSGCHAAGTCDDA